MKFTKLSITVGLVLMTANASSQDSLFAPVVNYAVGDGPRSVFSADFDGDGNNDLAVVNEVSHNVSILLNNGDGTFQSAINYGAGEVPRSIFAADLDGDTDYDLAVADWGPDIVWILKNNGDGTFQSAINYGAGFGPRSIFAADLDGDTDYDLAVANWISDNVSILKNNGDGTFQSAINYGAGTNPTSVFAADLDGDTDYDLALANQYSDNVSILKNNGDGTFGDAVNYGAGDSPWSVFSADLDGDNDNDLAVANSGSGNVSILMNLTADRLNEAGRYLWVPNYGDNTVSKVDVETHAVVATVPVAVGPSGIAVGRDYVYVTHRYSSRLYRLSKDLDIVYDSLDLSAIMELPIGVAIDSIGYAYVVGREHFDTVGTDLAFLVKIDPQGFIDTSMSLFPIDLYSQLGTIGIGLSRSGIGFLPWRRAWDLNTGIVEFNTADFSWTNYSISYLYYRGQGVGIDNEGNGWTAGCRSSSSTANITRLEPGVGLTHYSTPTVWDNVSGGVVVDPQGSVWVSTGGGLLKLNPETQQVDEYNVGLAGGGLACDTNGYIWAVFPDSNKIKKFDLSGNQVGASVEVGLTPLGYGDMTGYECPRSLAPDPNPNTYITSGPGNNQHVDTNEVTFTWTGSDDLTPVESLLFSYKMDDSAWSAFGPDTNRTFILAEGYHTFMVRAMDGDMNVDSTPATRNFAVDTTAPNTELVSGPSDSAWIETPFVTFVWTGVDNLSAVDDLTYAYKIDSDTLSDFTIDTSHTFTGLLEGLHTFTCIAKDKAGNEDPTPLVADFWVKFVDLQPTQVTVPDSAYCNSPIEVSWTATNKGEGLVAGTWKDKVYLSDDSAFGSDIYLGEVVISDSLFFEESYSITDTVLLPDSLEGNYWIIVQVDAEDSVHEEGNEDNNTIIADHSTYLSIPPPAPELTLSSAPFFDEITSFYPLSGGESTLFEFRINYQDSSNFWPELGYPQLILDWDGNGVIDHANDGYYAMSQTGSDSVCVDGTDYSVFTTIPAGGNLQIKFEAVSSSGLSAVYPESGWLSGPGIIDSSYTDLYSYADDITFSVSPPDYPEVGEPVIIYGRVHNNSPTGFDSVRVDLYIDEILAHSFYESLPARDGDGNAGFADIAFDTVFNDTAFVQVAITVDPEGSIAEWNELNNTAKRSLIIEGFQLPGAIYLNPFALGTYYPMSWVSGGGTAWYEDQGDSLEQLSGTPVYLKLLEGNVDLDTVYVNDLGYFSYSFMTPLDTGLYHIELKVTDFTLDAIDTVSFHVVPAQWPDLVIGYNLGGFPLTMCGNTDLTIFSPRVVNVGSLPSGPCKAAVMHGATTLLDVNVPALNPGELFVLAPNDLTVSHSAEGYYRVSAVVDYDHEVAEWSEWNNSKWTDYRVWCCPEDLQPTDLKLSGVGRPGRPVNILAKVYNQGGQASDGFSLTFVDMCCGSSLTDTVSIGTTGDLSLPAYGAYGWFSSGSYVFSDTGMHLVRVYADSGNTIPECREDNNVYSEWIYIQSMIDLYTSYDNIFVDNPDAVEGEPVQFQAKIGNAGDSGAYAFYVYFGLNGSGYTASPNVFIDFLPGGTDLLVEHPETWTVDFSQCPLEVFVDSGNQVAEYNEGNNHGEVPLPYDFYPYYGYRCPRAGKPSPYFFDTCGTVDTGVAVTITLTAKNAGIFRFNDSLLFSVYDSLAGDPSPTLIHSQYIHGPYEDHARNLVVDSLAHSFTQYGTHFVTVVANAGQVVAECYYDNNEATDSIIVEPHLPDLLIQSEWIDPSSLNPQLGEEFWVSNVDVYNLGGISAFDVDVLFLLSGDTLDTIVISEIAPGGYDYTGPSDTVVVDTCEPATRIVRVCADPFGLIEEEDELNNCATRAVVFCEGVDLYVSQVYFEYDCLCVDSPLTIYTVIANNGDLDASAIVDFYYTGNPQGGWSERTFLASASVETFSTDDSVTLAVPWQVPAIETYIYVDISYSYPWDFNGANDTALVSLALAICGDVNADGSDPNVADLTYLVDYLFRGGPAPPVMAAADVECSGGINIADLTYLVAYLFRSGPPPCEPTDGLFVLAAGKSPAEYQSTCTLVTQQIGSRAYKLSINGDFETEVAGFQQEYEFDSGILVIDSVMAGVENSAVDVYYMTKDNWLSLGMIDLRGQEYIQNGHSNVVNIYFHLVKDAELIQPFLSHLLTLAVDENSKIILTRVVTDRLSRLIPDSYALNQNYPNPFNPNTIIRYSLPKQSDVNITIYNILGQEVVVLVDKAQPAGYHQVVWEGKNSQGKPVASGIYFYRIEAGEFTDNKKMLLLK